MLIFLPSMMNTSWDALDCQELFSWNCATPPGASTTEPDRMLQPRTTTHSGTLHLGLLRMSRGGPSQERISFQCWSTQSTLSTIACTHAHIKVPFSLPISIFKPQAVQLHKCLTDLQLPELTSECDILLPRRCCQVSFRHNPYHILLTVKLILKLIHTLVIKEQRTVKPLAVVSDEDEHKWFYSSPPTRAAMIRASVARVWGGPSPHAIMIHSQVSGW